MSNTNEELQLLQKAINALVTLVQMKTEAPALKFASDISDCKFDSKKTFLGT